MEQLCRDPRTEEEMVQGIRFHLLDAIKVRLRADVKVGVALSGGIDSSVVAGMVNHLIREGEKVGSDAVTEKLSCFGVAFDEGSGFDESGELHGLPHAFADPASHGESHSRIPWGQILQEAYDRTGPCGRLRRRDMVGRTAKSRFELHWSVRSLGAGTCARLSCNTERHGYQPSQRSG